MVRWRRGELDHALEASTRARRHSPSDVYLAWQSDRLSDAIRTTETESDEPG